MSDLPGLNPGITTAFTRGIIQGLSKIYTKLSFDFDKKKKHDIYGEF